MKLKTTLVTITMIGAIPAAFGQAPTDTRQPSGLGEGADIEVPGDEPPVDASDTATGEDRPDLPGEKTIAAQLADSGGFSILERALQSSGLAETLSGAGPSTVFAPTDSAFGKLDDNQLEQLMLPENKEALAALLKNHVVSGKMAAADLSTGEQKTVGGQALDIRVADETVTVSGATVTMADLEASNGIIHAIDQVLVEERPTRREPASPTPPATR